MAASRCALFAFFVSTGGSKGIGFDNGHLVTLPVLIRRREVVVNSRALVVAFFAFVWLARFSPLSYPF